MVGDLRPYPTMKDSGVEFLGEVPEHWEVQPAKRFYWEVDERSVSGDEELLSVSHLTGVTPRSQKNITMFMAATYAGHKVCRPGDLVINTMWAWAAALGVSRHTGIVSPAYGVYRPRREANLLGEYADLLLRARPYVSEYNRRSTGIQASRLRLYPEQFLRIGLICPPLPEQAAIVRFLSHADRRTRRYILAKKKLVALLEEQRRAIAHRAVTRGLDPAVRVRPSGVEWLGDVPEHWELTRVKAEFICLDRRRVPLSGTARGAMTLRRYDYYGASGVIDSVDDYLFDDELLLIAEDGANLVLRNLPLALIARGKFWVNNHAHVLKPRRGNLEYLAVLMEHLSYLPWISGAAQPKLTQDRLMSIAIAVPSRREQDRIIATVMEETSLMRDGIKRARHEIELLQEYRTRLIAEVVTGKLDVREVAAQLPDDPIEPEPINADAVDDVDDMENHDEDALEEALG